MLEYWRVHPGRLTWNIIIGVWKIIFLSKWVICMFHVNLPGCRWDNPLILTSRDIPQWFMLQIFGQTSSWELGARPYRWQLKYMGDSLRWTTFPETNSSTLDKWWLGDDPFLLGFGLFSGCKLLVSGKVTPISISGVISPYLPCSLSLFVPLLKKWESPLHASCCRISINIIRFGCLRMIHCSHKGPSPGSVTCLWWFLSYLLTYRDR